MNRAATRGVHLRSGLTSSFWHEPERPGQCLNLEDQTSLSDISTIKLVALEVSICEHFKCVGDSFCAPPMSKPLVFVEQMDECLFWGRLNTG